MEWRKPPRIPKGHCSVHMTVSHRYCDLTGSRRGDKGQDRVACIGGGQAVQSGFVPRMGAAQSYYYYYCRTPTLGVFSFTLIF